MIVVTGAAGFIGSNIVADLELSGKGPIAVCDWFGSGDKWLNLAKRSIAAFVAPEGLIEFLNTNASAIRAVIHMGAISATTEKDVDRLVELNVNFSVNLWDWCVAARVPFVYASSAATYGARESDFIDRDDPASLGELRPLNGYGWSKNVVDQIFAARVADGRPKPPQWVGLKFFNVYGPNEYHKDDMRSVVAKLFDNVTGGRGIQLFKSYRSDVKHGEQKRDFIYVKDCSKVVRLVLDNPNVSGIFNVGTGTARSFLELAMLVRAHLNRDVPIEFVDMPEAIRTKYQYFTEADMTKFRSKGMKLEYTTLESGIADYLDQYLLTKDRYR
ncbi:MULTISPECIES: ADP-glyceromanno-heptose 6-epimerase [unclassified Bradyrhizobium]|uniref:ADP-glyceromanno-heptose 6-epimerase n=1 Tax=unclassified Bradyrhizobium TaxID=2631580 RepID=UPI001FF7D05A|nr:MULTISPECIES: ADP-glyceromanno-heptose 6-epimerase [unclassified Bradyrhizobium]MCK1345790.1 ADP-glyceromanno-heptose 6-epimerase [Bradyrhizobium sp. CW11]MCK1587110.1 ADP-glyceromanno-heptose 6-epimerase [Bradyrhizobium sp. 169]